VLVSFVCDHLAHVALPPREVMRNSRDESSSVTDKLHFLISVNSNRIEFHASLPLAAESVGKSGQAWQAVRFDERPVPLPAEGSGVHAIEHFFRLLPGSTGVLPFSEGVFRAAHGSRGVHLHVEKSSCIVSRARADEVISYNQKTALRPLYG
jgi:hypothetical protein